MSGKFSVEDILNEVKSMKGDHYISSSSAKTDRSFSKSFEKPIEESAEKIEPVDIHNDMSNLAIDNESFLPEDIDNTDDSSVLNTSGSFDISKMTPEEFFKTLENNTASSESDDSEIVGGFTVKADAIKEAKDEKQAENEQPKIIEDDTVKIAQQQEPLNDPVNYEAFAEEKPVEKNEETATSDTIIFDKSSLKVAQQKVAEQQTEPEKDIIDSNVTLKDNAFNDHKPNHLLSPEEINSNSLNGTLPLRFGQKIKDLTKHSEDKEKSDSTFDNPVLSKDEIETIEENNTNDVLEFVNKAFEVKEEQEEPQELNSEFDQVLDIPEITEENDEPVGIAFKKQTTEEDISSFKPDDNRNFARKNARRIEEIAFDYSDDEKEDEEVIDDYCDIDDEEPVRYDLDISLKKISKRLTFTFIAFVLSIFVTVFPSYDMSLLSAISPAENPMGFLIANLAVVLLAVVVNIKSIFRGLGSLITFKPDADSAVSFAFLLVMAQSICALLPDFNVAADKITIFSSAVIFAQILSLMGKKRMVARVKSNFRLVATTTVKQSCFVADERMGELVENDDFIGVPDVACSKSVINLRDYLRSSYAEDPSDSTSKLFAPIGLLATVLTFFITYFVSYDVFTSLSYATAAAIMSIPASVILAVNSPLKKAADILRQREGLLSGYEAVDEFSNVDSIIINAEEIFPAGAVELISLRAIGDISIEDVILKSAALTIGAGGPLADVFDKIIDGRRKMLPPVSDIVYEDGLGITGKIDGRVVRIGNRKFIDSYGVYGLSDDSLEYKAKKDGFFVVYTAIEDEVCGMFAVKYKSVDPDIEDALYELVSNGITIAIKSNDPNVTPELVEKVFEIPSEYVIVLESNAAEYYDNITRPSKNGSGMLAYSNNASVFAFLLVACKKLRTKISVAVVMQAILTILGFAACMFLAISAKGLLSPLNMILYHFAVAFICVFIPALIKRIK